MGVYKKKNRWYIDYSLPGGQRKRESVTIEGKLPEDITRADAVTCLSIRRADIAQGKFNLLETSRPVAFERLCEVYLNDYSKINKRSWKRDECSIKALKKYFNGKNLTQITPWGADRYKAERLKTISFRKRPVSKMSVNRELSSLKAILAYAVKQKWLPSNPLSGYKLFPEHLTKTRALTQAEFRAVYDCAGEDLKPILLTAYLTGMRCGEMLSLRWEDIDLEEKHLLVTDSKNGQSRYIPLNIELFEMLKQLSVKAENDRVFGGITYKGIYGPFNRAVKSSGVPKFTLHDLRHTFASNLVMSGVDIMTVSQLLGHKKLSMTQRYSHPSPEHKRDAIERLGSGLVATSHDTSLIKFKRDTK